MIAFVLPILFFSITTFTSNVTTLFRSGVITALALLILIAKPFDLRKYSKFILIFALLLVWYFVSFLVNDQSYANFLLGAYGRNFGFITLIGLFLLFLEAAEYFPKNKEKLLKSVYVLLLLANFYGIVQNIGLDPLNWEKGAGYGLTIGNPNFSSALFGMLSFLPIYYFLGSKGISRFAHSLVFISTIIQIFLSGSSQGFLLLLLNIGFHFSFFFRRSILKNMKKILYLLVLLITGLVISILMNLQSLLSLANSTVQFNSRIEHWKLGLNIFQDNWAFGVGIDGLSRFSGEYRTLTMRNWGQYTLPDRSHNVFIDFFATGGLLVGLSWIFFVILISRYAIILCISHPESRKLKPAISLSFVWILYITQTLLSPDNLVLAATGFICAGSIMGAYLNTKNSNETVGKA